MKTKNKMLAVVEIAIVLCSVFLVAMPAIAADQNQTMQKASASEVTTASEDNFVLGVYGNANEDDSIDMRDLTYVKLIFFGKKPETELADAKYDGEINPLDFIQIKLIIVGKENELTIIDNTVTYTYPNGKPVTVKKPIKRIIAANPYIPEALRTLKSKDKVVGIDTFTAAKKEFFPDISKLPVIGTLFGGFDVEQILSLNPDLMITWGGSTYTKFSVDLEDKLEGTGITLVRLDIRKPETFIENIRKLGYILDKKAEAEEFIDWYEDYMDTIIKERVDRLSEDEKPRVYLEKFTSSSGAYPLYTTFLARSGTHQVCTMAGGINIAADLPGAEEINVDPEWVMEQNPEIIIKSEATGTGVGYEVDDPSEVRAVIDEIMNRPELAEVTAVKVGKVYCICTYVKGIRSFVGTAYMAKWFHPDLFKDMDPEAIHKEYMERFQGIPYRGIYAYPDPS